MEHKVITISQQKGGAGKTTIAAHLGVAYMQQGYTVALLDVDPQQSLSAWYNARVSTLGEDNAGVDCYIETDRWRLVRQIQQLRDIYDIVIIDCPPHTKEESKIAVKEADLVLVPIQPSPIDLWATTNTVMLANQENVNTYLILNRVVYNSKLAKRFIAELPRRRLQATLGNRIAYPTAMSAGLCVTESASGNKGAAEVKAVATEVTSILRKIDATQEQDVERMMYTD